MSAPPSRRTYFDSLSEEALRNVLRQLSSAPSAFFWSVLVKPEDALSSVHPSSSLRSVARACFTHVFVVHDGSGWREASEGIHLIGRELLFEANEANEISTKLRPWLEVAGGMLLDLTLSTPVGRPTLRLLKEKIPLLRGLTLHYDIKKGYILDVLKEIGPTLNSLEIKRCVGTSVIKAVQRRCPNLTRISLKVRTPGPVGQVEYAKLLRSYGSQLQFALIDGMPRTLCDDVMESCPNILCEYVHNPHYDESPPFHNFDILTALAPFVKDLVVHVVSDPEENDLANASRECYALETIHLSVSNPKQAANCMKELFRFNKPLMHSVRLSVHCDEYSGDDAEALQGHAVDVFRELGSRGARLRKFRFMGQLQKKGAFKELVRGTPLLEDVRISLDDNFDVPLSAMGETLRDIVETFANCANLRVLEVTANSCFRTILETVANACCLLRARQEHRVYVSILGMDYLA